jgi:F420-dependent oxidoreductase-like protein
MKIGINAAGLSQRASIESFRNDARACAEAGFSSYWLAEHPLIGFDSMTAIAAIASDVPDIEIGTAIVPTFPRHPLTLAGQALTTNQALGGRFCLGVGLSHEALLAPMGISFEGKPIRHLREYLSILMPLLDEGKVSFNGETLSCNAQLLGTPGEKPCVVVAALGPQALKVAGTRTDGTTLAWTGPRTIAEHIVPRIGEAAAAAGKPSPRIIASLPVGVTDQPEKLRGFVDETASMYKSLPSYQAMFAREGVSGPSELTIAGSSNEVEDAIYRLQQAGVTDFAPSVMGNTREERTATRELLATLNQQFSTG